MTDPTANLARFTAHPHVTSEEAGTVVDAAGRVLRAGDPGFLEALAKERGFTFTDETDPQ